MERRLVDKKTLELHFKKQTPKPPYGLFWIHPWKIKLFLKRREMITNK